MYKNVNIINNGNLHFSVIIKFSMVGGLILKLGKQLQEASLVENCLYIS